MPNRSPLWWLGNRLLAGMSAPWIHEGRRDQPQKAQLGDFADDLPDLWRADVRGIVCLLNDPNALQCYRAAGFRAELVAINDGAAPTGRQARQASQFIHDSLEQGLPVAVHCAAGLGRTGTILASHLILDEGASWREAVSEIRRSEAAAIETAAQLRFLEALSTGRA